MLQIACTFELDKIKRKIPIPIPAKAKAKRIDTEIRLLKKRGIEQVIPALNQPVNLSEEPRGYGSYNILPSEEAAIILPMAVKKFPENYTPLPTAVEGIRRLPELIRRLSKSTLKISHPSGDCQKTSGNILTRPTLVTLHPTLVTLLPTLADLLSILVTLLPACLKIR